jgi:hypothetical protein
MVTRREQLGTAEHQLEGRDGDGKPETSGRRRRGKKVPGNEEDKEENKEKKTRTRMMKRPASAKTSGAAKLTQEKSAESAPANPKTKNTAKPKKAKEDRKQKGEKEMSEPKTEKRPRQGTNKKKELTEEDNGKKEELTGEEPKVANGDGDGTGPVAKAPKVSRTWAGRWIPSDPVALAMMTSIRTVFDTFLKMKFRTPSTLASPFYSQCIKSYKAKGLDNAQSTSQQLVAAAELEVEPFLKLESIRN